MDDFTQLAYFALQKENNVSLTQYVDIDQNIANKLINSKENLDELGYYIGSLKTKDITYTRLSRSILHIMLGLKDTNMNDYMNNPCEYARILGFKESSSTLLKTIKKNSSLNIVSKLSLGMKKLTLTGRTMLEMDINASNIYNKIVYWKYQQTIPNEYKHGVVIK
jgi:predicted nucleotidyltransferase